MSVLVMPYRHPLHWAKIATTIDHLARGRLILRVGVGWMAEEFDALGADFKERGAVADEQLELMSRLWAEDKPSFEGRYYRFHEVGFSPKPMQKPRIPIWVGGEGQRAQRRAARYGDAWFPGFPTSCGSRHASWPPGSTMSDAGPGRPGAIPSRSGSRAVCPSSSRRSRCRSRKIS
jgi:alkanesulfonate monooxygenase SsuD/methylene tetrahydromethanopterin reductase-like flavin-dependent oxidoreductase (luciferase family)